MSDPEWVLPVRNMPRAGGAERAFLAQAEAHRPAPPNLWRRFRPWLIAMAVVVGTPVALVAIVVVVFFAWYYSVNTVNVSISLSYVSESGQTYSCTYDYTTPNNAPMPPDIAKQMNERDWSQTGQQIYEWAKTHPSGGADSTWSAAMDRYVSFPPWQLETDSGVTYALWSQARPGSNCEGGLR
jgi:hypothetical protein